VSQHDFTHALARLLSDAALRRRFQSDRSAVASELTADNQHVDALCAINLHQLEQQALALLRKRQSHVAQIIPRTWRHLGLGAEGRFREFAVQSPWPGGHKRHFEDAAAFCRFLKVQMPDRAVAAEHNWAAFVAGNRRLVVRFDIRLPVGNRTRPGVQILFRNSRGVPRQLAVYLKCFMLRRPVRHHVHAPVRHAKNVTE